MFIVPYYMKTTNSQFEFKLTTLWLFLTNQGTSVWETDEKKPTADFIVREYLTPNGFYGKVKCVKENTLYFEVDTEKTKIQNFYNWIDSDDENKNFEEVWRPFFYVSDSDYSKQNWGWKEMNETNSLGSFGTVQRIWEVILNEGLS
jgi:hypothetical protein